MNKIILIGRLTRDPETRFTPQGAPVAKFGLAVDRRFKGKDGQKVTDFFDVDAWGKTAELVGNFLAKGRQVMIEGEMRREEWTDKEGQKRISWKVHCENVEFLGSKNDAPASGAKDEDTIVDEIDERTIDEELERSQPYGF